MNNFDNAKRLKIDLTKITDNFKQQVKKDEMKIPNVSTFKKKVYLMKKQE